MSLANRSVVHSAAAAGGQHRSDLRHFVAVDIALLLVVQRLLGGLKTRLSNAVGAQRRGGGRRGFARLVEPAVVAVGRLPRIVGVIFIATSSRYCGVTP